MPNRDDTALVDDGSAHAAQGRPQRLDKWLWYARVVKTRSLATALVVRGRVRVNRERTQKPSHMIRPGDVVTASVSREVRVLKVMQPGTRRGPASEAQTLYEDLSPITAKTGPGAGRTPDQGSESASAIGSEPVLDTGSGRPSKKERRQIVRLKGRDR